MKLNLLRASALSEWLERLNLVVFDVGARGGLDEDFAAAAWATSMVGFEPEPEEAARLMASPDRRWSTSRIAPIALGAKTGKAVLHLPASPVAASLLPHNASMVTLFGHPGLHETQRTVTVEILTLDNAIAQHNLPYPDYLKLDIEGAELGVLQAAANTLQHCAAIKVECAFIEQRQGQGLAHDVTAYLATRGFQLAEFRDIHMWRRRPIQAHPLRIRHSAPYSRGQLAQADLIFLRQPETLLDAQAAIRAAVTAGVLGFIDYGVHLCRTWPALQSPSEALEAGLLSASHTLGAHIARQTLATRTQDLFQALRSALNLMPADKSLLPY
jgi:FkbM family methyltransferase